MFIFLLQLREIVTRTPSVYLFALFSAIVWVLWIAKVVLSRRYRPATQDYLGTCAVVIPVVDEPLDLFADVLARITSQGPDEVLVVINGPRNTDLERVCEEAHVEHLWTAVPGKRNAVKIGVEAVTSEIVLLVDSDTLWEPDALGELLKSFNDASVGGATTRQRILDPNRSFLTRWADWLENSRALYSMPAQSVLGQIGCLPGRTIAFRRSVLTAVMDEFMTARFLGVFLEVSDDRTLTNLTLKAGYRTVYQSTSLVYTDAPLRLRKLYKQQLRWARGSQYNTLRMLPWMLGHAPVLAAFFVADIALPFILLGAVINWIWRSVTGTGVNFYAPTLQAYPGIWGVALVVVLAVFGTWISMTLRQLRHLEEKPSDLLRLPAYILFSSLFLMPIRVVGFLRMAHAASWGTRANAYTASQENESDTMTTSRTRHLNPQAGLPYLMAAGLLTGLLTLASIGA